METCRNRQPKPGGSSPSLTTSASPVMSLPEGSVGQGEGDLEPRADRVALAGLDVEAGPREVHEADLEGLAVAPEGDGGVEGHARLGPLDDREEPLHLGQERRLVDRLPQEVVRAGAPGLVLHLHRGEDDDRDAGRGGFRLQDAAGLDAVHLRHLDVEDDEVGLLGAGHADRLEAGRGGQELALGAREERGFQVEEAPHVVDEQYLVHRTSTPSLRGVYPPAHQVRRTPAARVRPGSGTPGTSS